MPNPVAHSVHNFDGVAVAALLQDGQIHRLLAVHADDVVLDGGGIFRVPDVAEAKHTIADGLQRHIVHLRDVGQLAVAVNVVVFGANANVARRQDLVGVVDDVDYVHGTHLRRLQLHGIDVKLDLAILAAIGLWYRCARHVGNLVANVELSLVVQIGLVKPLPLQGHKTNRQAGGVEFQHHRRQRSLRQTSQVGHGQVGNFTGGGIRVGARLEVHLDQAHTGQGARFDVIDIASQGEEALKGVGDVGLDRLRGHAAVESGHHHDRNVNGREKIDWHASDRGHANHDDGEAQHKNEEGILDRETRHWPSLRIRAVGGEHGLLRPHQLAWLIATQVAHDDALAGRKAAHDLDVVGA